MVDINVTLELGRALERIHFRSEASGYWWISIEDSSYFFNPSPWDRVSYSSGASQSSYLFVFSRLLTSLFVRRRLGVFIGTPQLVRVAIRPHQDGRLGIFTGCIAAARVVPRRGLAFVVARPCSSSSVRSFFNSHRPPSVFFVPGHPAIRPSLGCTRKAWWCWRPRGER